MTVRYDDVRRRLAQDLRDLAARRKDDPDGVFDQELLCVLSVGPGNSDDFADPADVLRLACIVDRPTCRNVADPADGGFECSECKFKAEIVEEECNEYGEAFSTTLMPRFCPHCGRKVVHENDRPSGQA